MKQPPLILAGSMEQARFYARRLGLFNPNEWRYVTPRTAMGYDRPTVYVVGTWWRRRDFREALDALLPSRPVFLDEHGVRVAF